MTAFHYNPWPFRLAVTTAVLTVILIFMGGLVTSHGAGMSVPDWPNSYGYNMFLFPPSQWIGGIFYEHTHRLMGTVVGMSSIALMIITWRERREWVRWLTRLVLVCVILQGVIGGLRVTRVDLDLAIAHACFAQAFLCLVCLTAVVTGRWWQTIENETVSRGIALLAVFAVLMVYGQLVIGAFMRHDGAGLAIPDVPLAYGKLLPPTTPAELAAANDTRVYELHPPLPATTLGQIWLHYAHRVGAVAVTIALIALIWKCRLVRSLATPAVLLSILLGVQWMLGMLTVINRKPADIASLHVAVGALILATSFILALRAIRLYFPVQAPAGFAPKQDRFSAALATS